MRWQQAGTHSSFIITNISLGSSTCLHCCGAEDLRVNKADGVSVLLEAYAPRGKQKNKQMEVKEGIQECDDETDWTEKDLGGRPNSSNGRLGTSRAPGDCRRVRALQKAPVEGR